MNQNIAINYSRHIRKLHLQINRSLSREKFRHKLIQMEILIVLVRRKPKKLI